VIATSEVAQENIKKISLMRADDAKPRMRQHLRPHPIRAAVPRHGNVAALIRSSARRCAEAARGAASITGTGTNDICGPRRKSRWPARRSRAGHERLGSNLVTRCPNEGRESRDQKKDNEHPILALETKKAKFLNEELHRISPFSVQFRFLKQESILFLYP
jgi:hypothetical protein